MAIVKLNKKEVRRLLRGEGEYEGVRADLDRRASAIATRAGEGFQHETSAGPNRARAAVWTATPEAALAEAEERALTRALDAGR